MMQQIRFYFLFLQFCLIVLLFNPFILLLLPTTFDSYDWQRLCQLGLFFSLGIQLCIDVPLRQQSFAFLIQWKTWQKLLLVLFFLLGILSALTAKLPRFALLEVASYFMLLFLGLSVAGYCQLLKEKFIEYTLRGLIICLSISAFLALWSYFYFQSNFAAPITVNNFNFISNFLASPGYMNRRFFDDGLVFLLPIMMWCFFRARYRSHWLQAFLFLLLCFTFARGILSGSRIYFYEPIAILVLFPILFGKKALPFLKLQIAVILAASLLYFLLYQVGLGYSWIALHIIPVNSSAPTLLSGAMLINLDGRELLWQIAWNLIKQHPLLGAGPLHYGFYAYSTEVYAAHPHSALLVFAAEWGLPALACLILLSLAGLIACIKRIRKTIEWDLTLAQMALLGALIGGTLMMSIDGLILMPVGQTLLAVTIGLCVFYFNDSQETKIIVNNRKWVDFGFIVLLVLALALIGWGIFPYLFATIDPVNAYLANCHYNCTISPDYWSQGFIQFY